MANRWFTQFFYTLHKKPVLLDCNFVVDSTQPNGIRSLKGPGISAVYMHSSSPGSDNPNPAAGYIMVKLQDSYQRYFGGFSGQVTPPSGSNLAVTALAAALTVGNPYIITSVGSTTEAEWHSLGVPAGIVPAAGVAFIAAATGIGTGSGQVQAPKSTGSGIDHIEVVGDANLMLRPIGVVGGGYLILRCMLSNATATPANESVIGLSAYLSSSFIQQQGE